MVPALAAPGCLDYGLLMNSDPAPSVPQPPAGGSSPTPVPKRRRWLLFGCGGLLALLVIMVATVALTIWWIQRPIKPVVLSAAEKKVVAEKIDRLGGATNRPVGALRSEAMPKPAEERAYTPGSRELRLTERELNGLLNQNTELGKTLRLELGRDAINAYLAVPIPQDFPIGGGKMFRARGRFRVSLGKDEKPYAILEDVTVFGLSLPKDWLGGVKGENLISDAVGERNGSPILRGIKSLHIVPGALVLEVEE